MGDAAKVYSEHLHDLLPVLAALEYKVRGGNQVTISSHDLPETALMPLVRALMRAEAELLLEDAETIDADGPSPSTAEQRRGVAFGRVFRAAGLAEGKQYRDDSGPTQP